VLRIRFLTTCSDVRYGAKRSVRTLRVELLLLIELFPGIHRCIGSEVAQTVKDTSTTHIIAISGFELMPIDALWISSCAFELSLERTRIALAIVSPISRPIIHANTVKTASNCGSKQPLDTGLRIGKLVDLHGLARAVFIHIQSLS